jgi:hypothetical protein
VRFDRRELAGALADIGVLVPIAVALIVGNGLSATAVLLPAGLLYLAAGFVYGLPIPVQPLKAFGAIAIAKGLGSEEIAAGALLMGVVFLTLGRLGVLDLAARAFPRALIRGVQLTVGLLFLKIAWGLLTDPPRGFIEHALGAELAVPLAVTVVVLAFALRSRPITIALVVVGVVTTALLAGSQVELGPSALSLPSIDGATLLTAFTVLVLPQIPLSFANSCLATADAARTYFGRAAERVRPGLLATTFGSANLLAGAVSGMPVCHGAGGLTAHVAFGARTGGAPVAMGIALLSLALGLGAGLASLLAAFPLPILAGVLATAGFLHIGLLRDLRGARDWALALTVGTLGFTADLALALALGLALWWLPVGALRLRAATAS